MKPGTVSLERFDGPNGADLTFGAEDVTHDDAAEMQDPFINPPRGPDEDLVGDAAASMDPIAAELERLAEQRAVLHAALGAAASGTDALRGELTEALARAVAAVARNLLPRVIDQAFATELAQAVVRLVAVADLGEVHLRLAPDDHDRVAEELSALSPPSPVTVVSDNTIAPGGARLGWSDGGADIDAAELASRAETLLAERITAIRETRTNHD